MRVQRTLMLAILMLAATRAWAVGEMVTDVRVENNARTQEDAVRSLAGISIGDTLEGDTLEKVRERLYTSGLFADVNVFWEPYKDGVRIVISIKDKFPWAPVPTFSFAPGNRSAGIVVGHGNLFGRGKRGVIGGRISNVDSGALIAYEDPAFFGTWIFWNARGKFQDQVISEFGNTMDSTEDPISIRDTKFRSLGFEANVGIAWFRRVKTSFGWNIENYDMIWSRPNEYFVDNVDATARNLPAAAEGHKRGLAQLNLTFDFRAREHAVMYGNALSLGLDVGNKTWGSDPEIDYWKATVNYEHGVRILRRHNLVLRAGAVTGERIPMWSENYAGGANLRGFVYRQFMGDTQLRATVEYHFPLFSISQLDVRGLLFSDSTAIWYRKLATNLTTEYDKRLDGRSFLPPQYLREGFKLSDDVHASAGGGLRFFLRSVAVPLVGADYGYGIGTGHWRFLIVLGV